MVATATIIACATTCGGVHGLIRLSGPDALQVAARSGLRVGGPWVVTEQEWPLAPGQLPVRVLFAPAGRSSTGEDLVEILLPGSRSVLEIALDALRQGGAQDALPGAFTRQALANGRLRLDQAEAVLELTCAPDEAAAQRALERLRGDLGREVLLIRDQLLHLRALIEAGLDFLDEADVRAFDPSWMREELRRVRQSLARWQVAASGLEGVPLVVLVGPANAGKSTLFAALTGSPVLISAHPGTTRDVLEEEITLEGRRLRVADTAGWMATRDTLEVAAQEAGRRLISGAAVVLACSAPDAALPQEHGLPAGSTIVVGTKADLGGAPDPRCSLVVSAASDPTLAALRGLLVRRLEHAGAGEPRQQRLLARCDAILSALCLQLPADELLAEEVRATAGLLGELIGITTSDDILEAIFSRFCIGK
jgi:tRNA modification GTPase